VKAGEQSPFALSAALAKYGIRSNPFPIDGTDDFFFSTRDLGKQLAALHNLTEYGDLLLVVSGVEGAGKTTVLNQFLLAADARWSICRIDALASMGIATLLEDLLTGFGVNARGDDAVANEALLRAHLDQVHARNGIALLVVDDAHLMPRSCLDFLLALAEHGGGGELRLLLATEPGRLGISTSDPKRVHVVVLKPLDAQQCGDYLNTRLSRAGLVGDGPFDASVVEAIHQDSGGIPGEIHPRAVHTLVANADVPGLRRRLSITGRTTVYVGLLLVSAAAVVLTLRPAPERDAFVIEDPAATGKVRGFVTAKTGPREQVTGTPAGTAVQAAEDPPPESKAGGVDAIERAGAPTAETVTPAAATGEDPIKGATLNSERPATIAAVAVTTPAPAKGEPSSPAADPVMALAKNVTPAVVSAPPPAPYGLEWLRRQNPSHYVIQLVGTRDASAARRFVDSHALTGKGGSIALSHENKPWHVVIYGVYPDAASARAAIHALPEPLRAGAPWPRSVASVLAGAR
jgi:DamX protein